MPILVKLKSFRILFAVLLAISVPFSIYTAPGTHTPLMLVAYFLFLPLCLKVKPNDEKKDIFFIWWMIFYIALNVLSLFLHQDNFWLDTSKTMNIIIFVMIPFIFVITGYGTRLSLESFIIMVSVIAIVASIIVIYQRTSYIFTGNYYKDFFIPGLESSNYDLSKKSSIFLDRPSAFFAEPSHFAQFVLPTIAFYLQKRNIPVSLILIAGVLFSGSTNGLAGLGVVVLFSFFVGKKISLKQILFVVLVIIGIHQLSMTEYMSSGMAKVQGVDMDNYSRLLGSLPIFTKFGLKEWVFGVGLGNRELFLTANHIFTGIQKHDAYMSSFFGFLANFGIIGFSGFIAMIIHLLKRYTLKSKNYVYLAIFVVLSFSTSMMFDCFMMYYFIFIMYTKELTVLGQKKQ